MQKRILFLLVVVTLFSCSIKKINFLQFEISELEQNGFSIYLDNNLIDLTNTYLNSDNILNVYKNKSSKKVEIIRKDKNTIFISLNDLLNQKKYNTTIDRIVINNIQIDSSKISKVKFELGAIKEIRLLTQNDYQGKEYDDLQQVKDIIGNGMLVINAFSLVE
ncbi:hypothetical protein [Flavobacterium cyclinae]|uniref:hypothetical protein n=1 Tax=Flavobacterium cyclinae TaxID=2895947 RepID=UPI001E39927A|nr:hypothetical protein [Flavobacterium cyclinae]UGS21916.1 hypothetical protein LOS86_04620 [Flavobacterium cyclinae]